MNTLPGSFEERSTWIQLLGLLLTVAIYALLASRMMSAGVDELLAYAAVFGVTVVLLVIVQIVGHILSAVLGGNEDADERDKLIEWRSESRSSWILAAGIILALVALFTTMPALWTAHILLASLYVATIAKLVLKLVAYRRGY